MNVLLATDYRVLLYDDRIYAYKRFHAIVKRYNENFGKVYLCTRSMEGIPDDKYIDITHLVSKLISVTLTKSLLHLNDNLINKTVKECDLVIGRFDSLIAVRVTNIARMMKVPYLAEVMADPWDGYWNHGIIGKLLAPYMYFANKKSIYNANYASYVTDRFLQSRYPCKGLNINASNVTIAKANEKVLKDRLSHISNMNPKEITVATTAAVNVYAKGQEFVIKALPLLREKGINVTYKLIGGGNQNRLRTLAKKLGVEKQVVFCGEKKLSEVLDIIDSIDVYIQPSLQEGLPRSVIEAMSRACPCIGARTAGTPELIDSQYVVKRKSYRAIAQTLEKILNQNEMIKLAKNNFNRSKDFCQEVLDSRRNEFYSIIKKEIYK